MKQLTPAQFIEKIEKGEIREVFSVLKRVYGLDRSILYDPATGRIYELCFMELP